MTIVNSRCVLFNDAAGKKQFRVIGSDLLLSLDRRGLVRRLGSYLWGIDADLDHLPPERPPEAEAKPAKRPGRPRKTVSGE